MGLEASLENNSHAQHTTIFCTLNEPQRMGMLHASEISKVAKVMHMTIKLVGMCRFVL